MSEEERNELEDEDVEAHGAADDADRDDDEPDVEAHGQFFDRPA